MLLISSQLDQHCIHNPTWTNKIQKFKIQARQDMLKNLSPFLK